MLPALGETSWPAAVVESERSVAGDVLWRNGHIVLDWRRRASILGDVKWQSLGTGGGGGHLGMLLSEGGAKLRIERLEQCQNARTQIISYAELRARLSGRRRHQMGGT